jgi:hypothetical protein
MFFRLHGQMQRIISQGGSSIDIVLGDLYEDIHWILLISGNILTLVNAQSIIVFNLFLSNPKRLVRCLIISVYLILVSTLHRKKTLDRQNCWHCFDFDTKWHVDNNFIFLANNYLYHVKNSGYGRWNCSDPIGNHALQSWPKSSSQRRNVLTSFSVAIATGIRHSR